MTSFSFDISEKELAGSQFVSKVGRRLIGAFVKRMKAEGVTKTQLAERLEVDKATVSKMLRGNSNLTARTIGEIAWALDCDPDLALRPYESAPSNVPTGAVVQMGHARISHSRAAMTSPSIKIMSESHQ